MLEIGSMVEGLGYRVIGLNLTTGVRVFRAFRV